MVLINIKYFVKISPVISNNLSNARKVECAGSNGATMKSIYGVVFSLMLTGCTASDWIDAAGGMMQAADQHEKDARNNRIKAANKAAGY
jgi:hypothetical protein